MLTGGDNVTHWTSPDHRIERTGPPPPTRLEPAWQAVSPTGKLLDCALYAGAMPGRVEVRAMYLPENLMRSELARDVVHARQIASAWREAALAKGFEELPPPTDP